MEVATEEAIKMTNKGEGRAIWPLNQRVERVTGRRERKGKEGGNLTSKLCRGRERSVEDKNGCHEFSQHEFAKLPRKMPIAPL